MSKLPLEGIRVADLCQAYAGPYGTRVLADLGAEVIKVEAIQRMDMPCRKLTYPENDPGDEPWNRGGYFHYLNVNKLDVTLNLNDPKGIDIFRRLVKISDVVTENFSPRVMENFGLDYKSLTKIKSDIIMVSMSGYGQTGPLRTRAAYAPVMEAEGGIAAVTGYEGGMPTAGAMGFGDWALGMAGACSALMALHYRNRTGKGQYIDVAGREASLSYLCQVVMGYTLNGRIWERRGNRHPSMAPHGCYRCLGDDEWIAIATATEEEWKNLCRAIGEPSWVKDERFSTIESRLKNQDELDRLIEEWTKQHGHMEAMEILQAAGVPAGAALDPRDISLNPHMKERGFFEVIDHPQVGKRPLPKQLPARFSSFEGTPRKPGPLLGEHNSYVLETLLGLSKEEVATLEAEKVIGTIPTHVLPKEKERKSPTSFLVAQGVARHDPDYLEKLSKLFDIRT